MKMNRRSFIVSSAAVTGGLALGFELPFGAKLVGAQDSAPEVNAWVVIQPNDTVVIRMARSEMGQGTITGLAQLVAEELECDWKKVTTEGLTPGRNLAAKRQWGDMSTGGSGADHKAATSEFGCDLRVDGYFAWGCFRHFVSPPQAFAAASATRPYVTVRPDFLCVMMLLAVVHSATGTSHWLAAACTSIMRAAAPPRRT